MLDRELSAPAAPDKLRRLDALPTGWAVSPGRVDYLSAVEAMRQRASEIAKSGAGELVWLLEHPPLYTAGVSAKPRDLLDPERLPVFPSGRGGQYTYHGPGQRVAYVMLDLRERGRDVRCFVRGLEAWIIDALGVFNVKGEIRDGRVGVWVVRKDQGQGLGRPGREDKIAAIGVRVSRWVSFHGVSLNVEPDLGDYAGIVPCGQVEHGVTSLVDLGLPVSMDEVDAALKSSFERVFGPVRTTDPLI